MVTRTRTIKYASFRSKPIGEISRNGGVQIRGRSEYRGHGVRGIEESFAQGPAVVPADGGDVPTADQPEPPVNPGVGLVAVPPHGPPVVFYSVHGSTVFNPAASNGAVSRVATIMPLAAAIAAM